MKIDNLASDNIRLPRSPDKSGSHPARDGGMLRIAAYSPNRETLGKLQDFLATDDGSVELQTWPADIMHLPAMVAQSVPDLLLLETPGEREDELQSLESVVAQHPDLAVILICSQQLPAFLLRAMRLGVREVMPAPVGESALQRAIGAIRERIGWRQVRTSPGKVLAFVPCKGGSGSTFLATNLGYALAAKGKRVCLIDLNLHFGDAALYVSENQPPSTVADLVAQMQRLDGTLLESSVLRISPGFGLLAAPDSPEKAIEVRPENIERLIGVARNSYDFVLLDMSRSLDANSIKALDSADAIHMVLQLTLPFIRDAGRLLGIFASLGYPRERVRLLVNRFEKDGAIRLQDVEKTLALPITKTVPNSFGAVAESINHGRPIVDLAPRDPVSRALVEFAGDLAQVQQRNGSWWNRLFANAAGPAANGHKPKGEKA